MSLARRVRAGIALHAGVNVVFAAAAVISATGGSVAAVASEGSAPIGPGLVADAAPRQPASHHDVHPLLGSASQGATLAVEPAPDEASSPPPTVAAPPTTARLVTPAPTTATTAPAAGMHEVVSTGYCLSGTTASGRQVADGMAAMNGVPLGTEWRVHSGPRSGETFEVTDRIGHGTQFDIWFAECDDALAYGRRTITIEQVG